MLTSQRRHSVGRKYLGIWLLVVASLLAALMSSASPAAAQDVPEPGGPELPDGPTLFPTIEPSTGLVDGQLVQITLTDLPAFADVVSVQCVSTALAQDQCDLSFTNYQQANAEGVYSVEFPVARQISVQGRLVDCAPDSCIIGVGRLAEDLFTPVETGGLAINFDASVPLPAPPTVKVAKNGKLTEGQNVKVTGNGWSSDVFDVQVEQCFTVAGERGEGMAEMCRYNGQGLVTVDGKLNFKTKVYRTQYLDNRRVDCATRSVTCRLVVRSYERRMQESSIKLRFSGEEPLAPRPKVNLSPRKNLVDGQTISLRLVNASSNSASSNNASLENEWALFQCAKGTSEQNDGDLEASGCQYLNTEFSGGVAQVTVARSMFVEGQVVDCASKKNLCSIQAMNYQTQASAKKGLIFAPVTEPVPEPAVVFSDNLDTLTDGALVSAKIVGPINEVYVSQCPSDVADVMTCQRLAHPDFADEGDLIGAYEVVAAVADQVGPGDFAIEGKVRRVVWNEGESTDCAAAPGTCVLVAWNYEYGRIGDSATLTFIDEGPPVFPAVEMKNENLAQRETVTATFTGMPTGSYLQVSQCLSGQNYRCHYLNGDMINEADFSLDVVVRRSLNVDGTTIDCGAEAGLCEMRFEFNFDGPGGQNLKVPLTFDPDAPPPPEAAITVEPRTKLTHRQPVDITVTNTFGYFGIAQCPNEVSVASGDCSYLGWANWDIDEATGTSKVTVQVQRVIATRSLGRVDCAETNRRCKLVVVDGEVGGSLGERWIQFDASEAAPAPPSISASQVTDLADGQEIEISASGDSSYLVVLQCAGEISGEYPRRCRDVAGLDASEGSTTFIAGVSRMIVGNDCAKVSCSLVLISNETGLVEAHQPLTFDPDAKRLGATKVSVSPTSGLADRQPVEVTVTGLVPWFSLRQCVVVEGDTTNDCIELFAEYQPIRRTVTTSNVAVRRDINGYDCATKARSCAVVVEFGSAADIYQEGELRQKRKLLTFDADAEPFPGPSVTVDPSTGLADGDIVGVQGKQFRPGFDLYVGICTADFEANNRGDFIGTCASEPSGMAQVQEDGSFDIEVAVSPTFESFGSGDIDCLTIGCVIMVTDGFEFILVDISFDPNATDGPQFLVNGLSWPESLFDGSDTPTNGFSQIPRFDLASS